MASKTVIVTGASPIGAAIAKHFSNAATTYWAPTRLSLPN